MTKRARKPSLQGMHAMFGRRIGSSHERFEIGDDAFTTVWPSKAHGRFANVYVGISQGGD